MSGGVILKNKQKNKNKKKSRGVDESMSAGISDKQAVENPGVIIVVNKEILCYCS